MDDGERWLWLRLDGHRVLRQRAREIPEQEWRLGPEGGLQGLLRKHYPRFEDHDSYLKGVVRLRVGFEVASNGALNPPYDIWNLKLSERHILDCGWTIAELTHQDDIDAAFDGTVVVDDPLVLDLLKAELSG